MVRLNGLEFEHHPGMTLRELVDKYNERHLPVGFEDYFVISINKVVITADEAREKTLTDNDIVYFAPTVGGG
jgi:molybdopterin converting factor small subunit